MNEEVKEILENFKRHIELNESMCCLSMNDVPILLDYITNLQEENERLTRFKYNIPNDKTTSVPTITKSYKKEYENYKSRCEKANEYIKSFYETPEDIDAYDITYYWANKVMEILNGGDDND